jgi:hypothetical protein
VRSLGVPQRLNIHKTSSDIWSFGSKFRIDDTQAAQNTQRKVYQIQCHWHKNTFPSLPSSASRNIFSGLFCPSFTLYVLHSFNLILHVVKHNSKLPLRRVSSIFFRMFSLLTSEVRICEGNTIQV